VDDFDEPSGSRKNPMPESKHPPILTSSQNPPAPPVNSTGKWILFGTILTIILTVIAIIVFAVLGGIVFWFCTEVGKLPI
tara:strand:- start:320 stop:559 length:240 start_codon:yes stop_codon:yes gene_type:complete